MFGIKELYLTNFRKYAKAKVSFSSGTNIIVGPNAIGKTTIVEAIYCLSFLKSYKTSSDQELLKHGTINTTIKGVFYDKNKQDEVVLSIFNGKKRIICNNKAFDHASDYLGFCNTVMFCPEDMALVKGAPLGRRKFLNLNIGQLNKAYYLEILNYQKILKARNELLKANSEEKPMDNAVFEIVTAKLIESAIKIIEYRDKFIQDIKGFIYQKGLQISNEKEKIEIVYKPNTTVKEITRVFKERRKLDEITKTTNTGPHRDDFSLLINGLDSSLYASQGQQRTIAIAIKLGLLSLIKQKSHKVILILDDVFSELDSNRQNELLKLLKMENQIFVTTTNIDNLSSEVLKGSKIINLSKEDL